MSFTIEEVDVNKSSKDDTDTNINTEITLRIIRDFPFADKILLNVNFIYIINYIK